MSASLLATAVKGPGESLADTLPTSHQPMRLQKLLKTSSRTASLHALRCVLNSGSKRFHPVSMSAIEGLACGEVGSGIPPQPREFHSLNAIERTYLR